MLSNESLENLLDTVGRKMVFSGGYQSFNEFKEELAHIRRQGYAFNSQPDSESLVAVAAAIVIKGGELVGILEVYGPAYRITREFLQKYGRIVRDVAGDVSARMGFIGRSYPPE